MHNYKQSIQGKLKNKKHQKVKKNICLPFVFFCISSIEYLKDVFVGIYYVSVCKLRAKNSVIF